MNMKVLKKSRKKVKAGDVFAFQIREGEFMYGRVISLEAKIGGFENVILLYIYDARSAQKDSVPPLDKLELLIPPLGTNRQPWLKGYFETVATGPLAQQDVMPVHCFKDHLTGRFFDDLGNELPRMTEPCGEYALDSYRTIDDAVSTALGIPLAPD